MGSAAHIITVGGATGVAPGLESRLRDLESLWSRFSPTSDITRLNQAGGDTLGVHPDTIMLVQRAIDGWRLTRGSFDPTVLRSMIDAGYGPDLIAGLPSGSGCAGIEVDPTAGTIRFAVGVAFDPGGVGKGLAADLVASEGVAAGAAGVLVNVGGDLRAIGAAPTPEGWTVGVEDPFDETHTVAVPRIGDGGVATSTPSHRRWTVDGRPGLHVVDPVTRRPIVTDVASVTVIAGEAWMAEVASKAAIVAGFDRAADTLDDLGVSGFAISGDGHMRLASTLGAFL